MIWKFDGEDLFDLSSPPVDELLESMGVDMRALEGATVLVTGGARGIGRQAALGFASLGAHVIVVDKQPAGQAVVDDITGADGSARFALVDIVEAEAFASVLLDAGPVDILVNNAVEFDVHSIVEMALADWDRKHAANSRAPFQATKAVLPGMLERGRGVIVNLIAPSGIAHAADMSASKAGLRSLTVSLAAEVGTKSGVSVYGFAPGLVATQLVREVFPQYAARLGLSFREYVERVRPNPGYSGLMPAEHCGASLVATALSATEHHGAVADAFRPLAAAGLIRLQPIQLETSGVVATPRDNAPRLREHVEAIYAQRLEEDRQVGISAQERAGLEAERDVRQTALLDVADRFKHLSGTSADAIVCADDEGNIVSWNTAAERLFGLTVSEALGRSVVSLVPALEADDVEGVLDTWGRRANGSQFPVQVSVARWATGGHGQIGLIVRDVSRRTAAEEDVRTLASIVRHSNDAIVTVSPDGILLSWNLSAERMFGYTASEIVGQPARILVPPERVSEHRAMMAVANHAGGKAFETVRLARDGTAIDVSLMVSQLRDADGIPIGTSGIIRDIREAKRAEERERLLIAANASTLSAREKARALERALHELQVAHSELKDTQEQLRQSTKMAAMGQLAGGIAHDFNNMLTAILNFAQFAADDLGPAHPVTPDIEEVLAAGRKTHMLTRQLLAFSRKTPVNPRVLDLNEVLVEIYALIRRMLGEHIEMLLEPLEGPCRVLMDRSQLEQIIVNLCLNARDAMPRGGHLKLSIERQTDVTWLPERSYVCIRVSDSGEGMTRETRERCFEPFFTTKPVGKGTGMGLAMAYGIVKQARGDVKVHTSMGAGTTFLIFLPEAEGVPELAEAPGQADAPGSRGERILLVEDQAEVRRAAVRILERAGYDVVEAEGAWEATSMDLRDVDLLLTDVVMPGISGPELARLLREAYPRMRVIFMSGYAAGATAHLMPDAGAPMLQKPFSHRQLMRHVREALDRALPRQPP